MTKFNLKLLKTTAFILCFTGILSSQALYAMEEENNGLAPRIAVPKKEGFNKLNSNCYEYIFSFLPTRDLITVVPYVSKKWLKEGNKDYCWMDRLPGIKSKEDYKNFSICNMFYFTKGNIDFEKFKDYTNKEIKIFWETHEQSPYFAIVKKGSVYGPVNLDLSTLKVTLKPNEENIITLKHLPVNLKLAPEKMVGIDFSNLFTLPIGIGLDIAYFDKEQKCYLNKVTPFSPSKFFTSCELTNGGNISTWTKEFKKDGYSEYDKHVEEGKR